MNALIQQNLFILMALMSGILASLSSGIMGTYVVIKRISFLSGSLSHAILGGMGFFLYLERTFHIPYLSPDLGALITALGCALFLGYGHYKFKEREDTLISIIWSLGMSIGVIFLAITPGTNVDVLNYLFGNLLWTGPRELLFLSLLFIGILLFHLKNHLALVALSFDEKQAILSGVRNKRLFTQLLLVVGVLIIFLIKTVGAILVMSMLTIPTATAAHYVKSVKKVVYHSMLLGTIYTIIGIWVAYYLNWPLGATITLMASLGYTVVKIGAWKALLHRAKFLPKRFE